MAELVLGIGSSHSPMVTMTGEDWLEWGERDHQHPMLYTREGRHLDYAEQLALADGRFDKAIEPDQCRTGAARVQAAVETLANTISAAELDLIVVVGDDQDEHLLADNLPPFLVFWGATIPNGTIDGFAKLPPLMQHFLPGYKETDGERHYPVASGLARHVIDQALAHNFDVAASERLPQPERGMGHAFGFPLRRLIHQDIPIVPIMVNTYNPPSQPRAARCAAFGAMLRDAIDSFADDLRVGVIASGGLSHFIVLEELDREVLDAFARHDLNALTEIPEQTYVAGTSEIKNWITTAAACRGLDFTVVDYVPGYRTPAGTGTGLAFGIWQ